MIILKQRSRHTPVHAACAVLLCGIFIWFVSPTESSFSQEDVEKMHSMILLLMWMYLAGTFSIPIATVALLSGSLIVFGGLLPFSIIDIELLHVQALALVWGVTGIGALYDCPAADNWLGKIVPPVYHGIHGTIIFILYLSYEGGRVEFFYTLLAITFSTDLYLAYKQGAFRRRAKKIAKIQSTPDPDVIIAKDK